jgi:asparagine synthase (glutamine-hydrolysing)
MKNIETPFLNKKIDSIEDVANLFEYWDWMERQAKFIANNCRLYEFWGYEWRMPFWDREFVDFWRAVPLSQRLKKNIYKDGLFEDDYKKLFSRYNYKNYEKRDLKYYFKSGVFGKYLSMLHKRFYSYHKFQYLDIVGYKDLIFKYRNLYNINSILAIKYLKTLETE